MLILQELATTTNQVMLVDQNDLAAIVNVYVLRHSLGKVYAIGSYNGYVALKVDHSVLMDTEWKYSVQGTQMVWLPIRS